MDLAQAKKEKNDTYFTERQFTSQGRKNSQNRDTVGSIYPQISESKKIGRQKEFPNVEVRKKCPPSVTAVTTKIVKSG
jgi:hypothetical protein